jgi:short-subunit dehydrogenase
MLILVLGASSYIGAALAEAFCLDNSLILVGRNVDRLITAANKCKASGAAQVAYVEEDFSLGVNSLLQAIEGKQVDLIIDAASASSSKRDSEIKWSEMSSLISADFLSRTKIMEHILQRQGTAPAVIFISTVLTLVKSPGRSVYTALKGLYETYLNKLKHNRPDFNLLIVYVGTVIDATKASNKPEQLALAVAKAFSNKREKLFFGLGGMFFLALFYLQPVIFYLVTLTQRKIRKLFG